MIMKKECQMKGDIGNDNEEKRKLNERIKVIRKGVIMMKCKCKCK